MTTYFKCFLPVFLFLSLAAVANPQFQVREADLNEEELKAFAEKAHHVIEGEENVSLLKQTISKFNFKKQALNRVRFYFANRKEGKHQEHAFNLVFMLGVSHTIETLSAPAYFLYGILHGENAETLWKPTLALSSQALPGIDFVCILLTGIYVGSEDFRKVIKAARVYSVSAAKGTSSFIGLTHFLNTLIIRKSPLTLLSEKSEVDPYLNQFVTLKQTDTENAEILDLNENPILQFSFRNQNPLLILEKLKVFKTPLSEYSDDEFRELKKHLKSIFRRWEWGMIDRVNIKDMIFSTLDLIRKNQYQTLAENHFIHGVQVVKDGEVISINKLMDSHEVTLTPIGPADTNLNEVHVEFLKCVLPVHGRRELQSFRADKMLIDVSCILGKNICRGAFSIKEGVISIAEHPQIVLNGIGNTLLFVPQALFTTAKIGLQVASSTKDAVLHVLKTLISGTWSQVKKGSNCIRELLSI